MKKKNKSEINTESEKSLKKVKTDKEKLGTRFIKTIKKRWLISGFNTILLIAILIAIFILINSVVRHFDFTAIDFTQNKNYTLSDESKDRLQNIDQDINIYLVGYTENDGTYELAKQYSKISDKIKVEIVDATENQEFANKYNVSNSSYPIVVEAGENNKVITSSELYTYDENYNTVDLTEQKITSAIVNLTQNGSTKVYMLTGYTNFSTEYTGYGNSLYYLVNQYIANEPFELETLDLLKTKEIPDDCDTLLIITPQKDFDEIVADEIIDYINNGGNILWLNGAYTENVNLTNVNKVLAQYGINPFETGVLYETDRNNTVEYNICFAPQIQYTDITSDIATGGATLLLSSTKININADKLEDLNVTQTDILLSSDTTYFTKNMTGSSSQENDTKGQFTMRSFNGKIFSRRGRRWGY